MRYWSKIADFDLPNLYVWGLHVFGTPFEVTPVEFGQDLWQQKTSSAIVWHCLFFLCLAVLVEQRLVTNSKTDRRTDSGPEYTALA